ncbi:spore coat associated protein CotJA [Clostridium sardiniense]|uniref:Spore coat associated protein CotJA n=2 Tax=Clostridium sardiniense TaxID=29369 RepID=A0ABS7L1G0_CLOSR|nr:spore coat associated protein CotJA [Clostridium sardiniense]
MPNCKDGNSRKNYYAKAYVLPQLYENLFTINSALKKGTIFKDLYKPYHEK